MRPIWLVMALAYCALCLLVYLAAQTETGRAILLLLVTGGGDG